MRFHTGTLLFFDLPLNFLKSLMSARYVACSSFPCLGAPREVKRDLAFSEIFGFEPDSFIKLFSSNYLCRVKTFQLMHCAGFTVQAFVGAATKRFSKCKP